MFQFPSNGKVYPKFNGLRRQYSTAPPKVSIPFKRESVSKDPPIVVQLKPLAESFNSLQTGKCIQSSGEFPPNLTTRESFNSLQTGKCIQRTEEMLWAIRVLVSIPFKRESVSKEFRSKPINKEETMFQFPSNGKVYPKVFTST